MKYLKIDNCDLNNGVGARITLWVSGCDLYCKGCHNSIAWDFNKGIEYTESTKNTIIELLKNKYIAGLSILGGEPLHPRNREYIYDLCNTVKEKFNNKDIWIWTGYDITSFDILPNSDYIIDGKFNIDKPTKKKWRGSDNQRFFKIENGNLKLID